MCKRPLFSRYNKLEEEDTYRVVGFEVSPRSVDMSAVPEEEGKQCSADVASAKQQEISEQTTEIKFSYDVTWEVRIIYCAIA